MIVKRISYQSPEFRQVLEVRTKVLREPLGLAYSAADLEAEANDFHLGAFDAESAIGSLILRQSQHPDEIVMRQVSVSEGLQGKGVGRAMVEASEAWARELGKSRITLHARVTAIAFYEALGYSAVGPEFLEVGIPHRQMVKDLSHT
jgi:predicted GNAT family N-acyltransferase